MVLFALAGASWPLDDRSAETLANALRTTATRTADAAYARVSTDLADAVEHALVEPSAPPVAIDDVRAEALLRQLNVMISNPDTVEPAYDLYLEVRRVLGRLYS